MVVLLGILNKNDDCMFLTRTTWNMHSPSVLVRCTKDKEAHQLLREAVDADETAAEKIFEKRLVS